MIWVPCPRLFLSNSSSPPSPAGSTDHQAQAIEYIVAEIRVEVPCLRKWDPPDEQSPGGMTSAQWSRLLELSQSKREGISPQNALLVRSVLIWHKRDSERLLIYVCEEAELVPTRTEVGENPPARVCWIPSGQPQCAIFLKVKCRGEVDHDRLA